MVSFTRSLFPRDQKKVTAHEMIAKPQCKHNRSHCGQESIQQLPISLGINCWSNPFHYVMV